MPTRETPFVTFWRAHNTKLAAMGQPAATNSEAIQAFKVREETKEAWRYSQPPHQRNAGKNL